MKKKIGILTFQKAINLGASLQTFALNKYINSLGKECETIDYSADKIAKSYKLIRICKPKKFVKNLIKLPENYKKKKLFNNFIEKNVKLSKEKYTKENISETNKIYDKFIVGSDQVWNYDITNDYNYYLKFVDDNNKRYSYAASLGNVDNIDKNKEVIEKELKKFDLITVREKSAIDKLKTSMNVDSKLVLDPTFLLDKKEYVKIINKEDKKEEKENNNNNNNEENNENKEKYILVYFLQEPTVFDIAKKLKKLTGYKIKAITGIVIPKNVNDVEFIKNSGVENFLSLLNDAEYVVTDSFHGVALSIIFRKNLKVVLKKKNQHLNDRMTSILDLFNLKETIVDNDNTEDKKLIEKIDYKKSEGKIKEEIEKSKEVVNKIVNDN